MERESKRTSPSWILDTVAKETGKYPGYNRGLDLVNLIKSHSFSYDKTDASRFNPSRLKYLRYYKCECCGLVVFFTRDNYKVTRSRSSLSDFDFCDNNIMKRALK